MDQGASASRTIDFVWCGARAIACPPQYRSGRDQLFRNSEREREELTELKVKAKPKTHATTWKQAAE